MLYSLASVQRPQGWPLVLDVRATIKRHQRSLLVLYSLANAQRWDNAQRHQRLLLVLYSLANVQRPQP